MKGGAVCKSFGIASIAFVYHKCENLIFGKIPNPFLKHFFKQLMEVIMERRSRKNLVKIYLNDDEKVILEVKMKRARYESKSAFIRSLIRYGLAFKLDYKFIHEYTVAISKIGNNINQIAYKVNATDCLTNEEYLSLRTDLEKIWKLQKSILSKIPTTKI